MKQQHLFIGILAVIVLLLPHTSFAARSFTLGSSGYGVTFLQKQLITLGYLSSDSATGYFGPLTQAAVEKFQCTENIICSGAAYSGYGIAGPLTQQALYNFTNPEAILTGTETRRATGKFEISGWIPYWSTASGTQDVLPHLNQLTSVMPFNYTVTANGHLYDAGNITGTTWSSFIATAKQAHVRVVPTVMWGNSTAEQAVLTDPTSRIALENEIVATVRQNNFDGIDIDFEAKTADTRNAFSAFLRELYPKMGNKWVYCTVEARMPLSDRYAPGATIPLDATDYANDYTQMNRYCDRVEIMAYDQGTIDKPLNKEQTGPYAPVADPKWVSDLVNLAAQSIARNKIIIGVPTYGYEYSVTPVISSSGYQYKYQMLWPFNQKYALDLMSKLGISPIRNSAGEPSFTYVSSGNYSPTGDEVDLNPTNTVNMPSVSYTDGMSTTTGSTFNLIDWSDAQAIAQKVTLAKQLGVRGVAIFKLDGGEDPNIWNVLP